MGVTAVAISIGGDTSTAEMLLILPLSHLALVTPPRRAVLRDAAAAAALALPWLPPHAALAASLNPEGVASETRALDPVSYTHLTLPTIYSV